MFDSPFRWDLTHESYLGGLLKGEKAKAYQSFYEDLLSCSVRVLALAGDSDVYFVGRSPESIFDFLSGIVYETPWFDRFTLLLFSMRFREEKEILKSNPVAFNALKDYFKNIRLHPKDIATRERPLAFVDLVCTGDTFGRLVGILKSWSEEENIEWNAVKRRIKIIGVTQRTKSSPNTERWNQHCNWVKLLKPNSIKNVSVSYWLWDYLGNYQSKVSRSYTPENWGNASYASPSYEDSQLKGLRLAYEVFNTGKSKEMRFLFASRMAEEKEMKEKWYRDLLLKLKSK